MNHEKALKIVPENDKLFKSGAGEGMKSRFIEDFQPMPLKRTEKFVLSENIRKQTTIECILENRGKRVLALNFANAHYPGGGYRNGALAQEESLCRASMLYYTICNVKEFYENNYKDGTAFYTDGMILSENVPIIRDDNGDLLEFPMKADFLTSPAVNRNNIRESSNKHADEVMKRRIEKIVSFMQSQHPDVIVLGAFGCGVFKNKREVILPFFEEAVNKYTDGSAEIIFAIP